MEGTLNTDGTSLVFLNERSWIIIPSSVRIMASIFSWLMLSISLPSLVIPIISVQTEYTL